MVAAPDGLRPLARWWVYQRERFPLAAHGPLVAAFAGGAVCASALLRDASPRWATVGVAFVSVLGFFFQLRVADEFKDAETDRLHRPYRPVPRGLVTLRGLALAGGATAALQLALALWWSPRLVGYLALVWAFGAAMTANFGVRRWLEQRPLLTLVSHGLVVPLIALYAAACDFAAAGAGPPDGLGWFLAASLFGGNVIEIGRKVRAPADEEPGVETYSALWGRSQAAAVWLLAVGLAFGCALVAGRAMGALGLVAGVLGAVLAGAALVAAGFVRQSRPGSGKRIEAAAAVWTLATYLALGPLPLLVRWLTR